LILVATSAALFFKNGEIPPTYPWSDESEIAADAVATLRSGPQLFYPGQLAGGSLAVWLEAGWMALFGKSLVGLRLLNGLVNVTTLLLFYLLVRELPFEALTPLPPSPSGRGGRGGYPLPLGEGPGVRDFSRWLAGTAALLMAVSLWLLGLGRIATPNWSLVPLMTVVAFYCFWRGVSAQSRLYLAASGGVIGLLFYGYLPGYFVPLVPALYLILAWLFSRPAPHHSLRITPYFLLPLLLVAAPILIFFAQNPAALLQRPLQLSDTNEGSWWQGGVDMLSAFGLLPGRLLTADFEHLAFNPLVTVLFVVGLLLALQRWREPAYLFLLIWWAVGLTPALLSRSASVGFIFEVWRRGVGAQPVSFVFPALAIVTIGQLLAARSRHRLLLPGAVAAVVIASGGLNYWLYFERWGQSEAAAALFAEAPVKMVAWMEANGQSSDTLFLFPLRPNVSPTTRPELFTVRYLYEGQAGLAFPEMDEGMIEATMAGLLDSQPPGQVKLMMSSRITVDPKGYFEYALARRGEIIARETLPDYEVITYRLRPGQSPEIPLAATNALFGDALRLAGGKVAGSKAAGGTIGVALRWAKVAEGEADYNTSLVLYDAQGYELTRSDKPLLRAGDYATTGTWPAGEESTLYYTLPLPPDVPPGRYTLRVVAYDAVSGARLVPTGGLPDLSLILWELELGPNPVAIEPAGLTIAQPLDTQFPGGLHLLGLEHAGGAVNRPGDALRVTLLWQATEPLTQNVGLVLALARPDEKPIPLAPTPQPLIVGYPTTAWPPGHPYRANYTVRLPATLATDTYGLALRLVDLESSEAVGEQILTPLAVEARPHIFDVPPLAQRLGADFGGLIRLVSFEYGLAPAENSPEPQIRVQLQWQALRELPVSYKVFIHLVDPATGQIAGQIDALPAARTTGWLADEIIADELTLPAPPPGSYRLLVGLYDEQSGARLPAGDSDHVVLVERLEVIE
jgi:4-amino-4-deoxy-L-arabinose transferase-like glycosyltransferase